MFNSDLKLTSHQKISLSYSNHYRHKNTFHPFMWAARLISMELLKYCDKNLALIFGGRLFFLRKPFAKKKWGT